MITVTGCKRCGAPAPIEVLGICDRCAQDPNVVALQALSPVMAEFQRKIDRSLMLERGELAAASALGTLMDWLVMQCGEKIIDRAGKK